MGGWLKTPGVWLCSWERPGAQAEPAGVGGRLLPAGGLGCRALGWPSEQLRVSGLSSTESIRWMPMELC